MKRGFKLVGVSASVVTIIAFVLPFLLDSAGVTDDLLAQIVNELGRAIDILGDILNLAEELNEGN